MEARINVAKLKKFLQHFQKAKTAVEGREKTKEALIRQVMATKKVAVEKQKKEKIKKEFEKLEALLALVINNETLILSRQQEDEKRGSELKTKIAEFESKILELEKMHTDSMQRKLDELTREMKELREKIQEYVSAKRKHEERVAEIEKKIGSKIEKRKEIIAVESKIAGIEYRLEKLIKEGKHDPNLSSQLRKKLDFLKDALKNMSKTPH
ncbi:MAG TPA: hypothetical protein VI894_01220 [Candidatus Nanoarchaeia archaeon]|nr:hypothetical protein [Candidatus Nanoarchaeia archaeon]